MHVFGSISFTCDNAAFDLFFTREFRKFERSKSLHLTPQESLSTASIVSELRGWVLSPFSRPRIGKDLWIHGLRWSCTSKTGVPYQIGTELKWRGRVSGGLWARRYSSPNDQLIKTEVNSPIISLCVLFKKFGRLTATDYLTFPTRPNCCCYSVDSRQSIINNLGVWYSLGCNPGRGGPS